MVVATAETHPTVNRERDDDAIAAMNGSIIMDTCICIICMDGWMNAAFERLVIMDACMHMHLHNMHGWMDG
mgnify:CR=1 FL=1